MDKKTSQDVVAKPSKSQLKAEAKLKLQQEQKQSKRADLMKFVLAALLVAAGLWAFYALAVQLPVYVRSLFPVVGVAAAVAVVFLWTATGRQLTAYVRESVSEAKKVVWPERNETLRMTLFVIAFVGVLALFIWGVDSLISWLFFDIFMKRS